MSLSPILLVEDDDNDVLFMRNAAKKVALANPISVLTNGQAAIDYLSGTGDYADRSAHPLPCLVILDLNLPCRTGFEVLEWVHTQPQLRTLAIIVLTASSAASDARRAYTLGANSYVVKPSNPEQLREFLSMVQHYWLVWNYAPTEP
jgi:CheY-like chemotaxis protein